MVFYRRPITPKVTRFMCAIRQAILTIMKSMVWLVPLMMYFAAVTRLHFGYRTMQYAGLKESMKGLGRMAMGALDYETL